MTEDRDGEEAVLKAAHLASLYNHELLAAGGRCGCFYCLKMFDASEVDKWVGKNKATALCPYCHIDAVLPSVSCATDPAFLKCMNDHWFKRTVRLEDLPPGFEVPKSRLALKMRERLFRPGKAAVAHCSDRGTPGHGLFQHAGVTPDQSPAPSGTDVSVRQDVRNGLLSGSHSPFERKKNDEQ